MRESEQRRRLIESHLRDVGAIASRFVGLGETREDLVQVGALALVRAVDRLDPARSATARAYLARCVEGEIRRHLRDRCGPVRVPRRAVELQRHVAAARKELVAALGREPSVDELARAAGLRRSEVVDGAAAAGALEPLPLREEDVRVEERSDEETILARALVARAVGALDGRARRAVLLRYYLDWSQSEIAAALGISQPHVSRLLADATATMRLSLGGEPRPAWYRQAQSGTLNGDGGVQHRRPGREQRLPRGLVQRASAAPDAEGAARGSRGARAGRREQPEPVHRRHALARGG